MADEQPNLFVGVRVGHANGRVYMRWTEPIDMFAVKPEAAIEIATGLIKHANLAARKDPT